MDTKHGKPGAASLARLETKCGPLPGSALLQTTPSGGRHYLLRVPPGVDPHSLPNAADVLPGLDVFTHKKQFVLSPSRTGKGAYQFADPARGLPAPSDLPALPSSWVERLQALAGRSGASSASAGAAPDPDPAPDPRLVIRLLDILPAPAVNTRDDCVAFAMALHGALADADPELESDAEAAFLRWGGRWPGAIPDHDLQIWRTTRDTEHRGWRHVLADAHRFLERAGAASTPEDAGITDGADLDAAQTMLDKIRLQDVRDAFVADLEAVYSDQGSEVGRPQGEEVPVAVRLFRAILRNPNIELFHSSRANRPHVRLRHRGRWQTRSLDSDLGKGLLRHILSQGNRPPSTQAFNDAVQLLRNHARFEAPAHEVYVRVARVQDTVYIDLGDDTFRAIEVSADGWRVTDDPPVRFVRSDAMQALSEPVTGGSVEDFRPFFATDSEDDLRLLIHYDVPPKKWTHR